MEHSPVREQVDRLAASPILRNSDTQRRLLSYLVEKSLDGSADRLKEYTVGIEALGKPESYDPRQDPSVRIHTSKLRQRLEEYYRTEGAADSIRVDFPKGGFKLVFSETPVTNGRPARTNADEQRWRRVSVFLAAALGTCLVLLVFAGARLRSAGTGSAEPWTPELRQIWEPFVADKRPLLLCLGTPMFIHVRDAGFFRTGLLNDWPSAEKSPTLDLLKKMFPGSPMRPLYGFTGVGEATAAFHLARMLGRRREDIALARSNVLSWEDIASSNAIFLGPPKFVPHLKDIPVSQDLVVDSEAGLIRNLRPRPGEAASYSDQPGAPDAETHALISRLPGLHGSGEIFIFASNWTAGTLGAVQYATQPDYARDLVQRLRLPSGDLPRHYQVLVRLKLQNLYPIQVAYVTHHVLNTVPVRN